MAQTDLIAGDGTTNSTMLGGDDGSLRLRVGPSGAKVTGMQISSAGVVTGVDGSGFQKMVLSTTQNTTSGTSVGFTSIPSWVKRITIQYAGISTSGTSDVVFRIGNGSYIATGYVGGTVTNAATNLVTGTVWTTGALLTHSTGVVAAAVFHGTMVLTLIDSTNNRWVFNGTGNRSDANVSYVQSGNLALAGSLDRVQIATVNGTDTFDAGSVNILYEG